MTEQKLIEHLSKSIFKIEDQLLLRDKIELDRKANIIVKNECYTDIDVNIYNCSQILELVTNLEKARL